MVRNRLRSENASLALSLLYPFCESLCSFGGCNTSNTKNHSVEDPYVETILTEYSKYLIKIPEISQRELKEIHLGGGTPTYRSERNLEALLRSILERMNVSSVPGFSLEVDPSGTRDTQWKVVHDCGFRRVRLGVQDFDPEVQRLVNRTQPFEMTDRITDLARKVG
ncbi:radical SAM protein, partial [Leptospira borgpetersenii serovar Hardjo-bovis]|nr:radical SAM protein [Leptospira borgpetersenii serovar Hardjo-bovis]